MVERRPYQRLQDAFEALGGTLTHEKADRPQGGAWILYLGGHTLEIPSTQSTRFPDLDACYRLKPGVAASDTWADHVDTIEPLGLARLLQKLAGVPPMAVDRPPALTAAQRTRLEARLKERLAAATEDFKRVFGYAPARWLSMEHESGTLGACQRILLAGDYVAQLTPLWEKKRLHQTVEAIALEPDFEALFTYAERATARARLTEFGFFGK